MKSEYDRGPLRILLEQSKILNRLVSKKLKSVPEGQFKTALQGVSAELQFIDAKLKAIDEKLEVTPFLKFYELKEELGKMIKEAQANIKLVFIAKKKSNFFKLISF